MIQSELDILDNTELTNTINTIELDQLRAPSKKIKVLHTIRQGQIGGGETHVLDIVSNIDHDFFDVEVLSFTEGEMVDRLADLNIKCHLIHTEKAFDFRVWNKVSELLSDEDYDIVHAHGTRAVSNTFWGAHSRNIPLIYTVHGWSFHPDQNKIIHKFREKSESFLSSQADVTVNVSNNNKLEGNRLFGLKESLVIPNGVNTEKFKAVSSEQSASLKGSLNIPTGVPVIGFIARFTKQKSPLTFVRAAQYVLASYPDAIFLMIGDGELKDISIKATEELGISNSFRFTGFRTDIPEMLSTMDIYCLPSLWEGLPIGVLEAMAMQKVVIATAVNGTSEVISDGQNGLLFQPNDTKELAEKITSCLSDQTLMMNLSKEAVNTVNQNYHLNKMIEKIEKLYTKLYNSKKPE